MQEIQKVESIDDQHILLSYVSSKIYTFTNLKNFSSIPSHFRLLYYKTVLVQFKFYIFSMMTDKDRDGGITSTTDGYSNIQKDLGMSMKSNSLIIIILSMNIFFTGFRIQIS